MILSRTGELEQVVSSQRVTEQGLIVIKYCYELGLQP